MPVPSELQEAIDAADLEKAKELYAALDEANGISGEERTIFSAAIASLEEAQKPARGRS